MNDFVVKGIFLDTPNAGVLRVRDGYGVCLNGLCGGVYERLPEKYKELPLVDWSGYLIIPGMTDLHLHAPQYSYAGLAMDLQLLEWLNTYTFPEEGKYSDLDYAKKAYRYFVQDLLHTSTTRACIFATIHTDATLELMDQLEAAGLECYVGKLNMDRNSPDYYCETSVEEGMKETRRWIDSCRKYKHEKPMITPRFTPSVTDAYMKELGRLALEQKLSAQSHLDENLNEISWVQELCPDAKSYADTYDRFGLFGGAVPTVMAHCIYCSEEEKRLMQERKVMIAHCPTSNENVVAGIAPAAEYLRHGYRIGLGSDVAGGHTLNLFEVMRSAIQVSKLHWLQIDAAEKPLTFKEAFYLATAGGGSFFGKVGLFEEGYDFDAVVIDDRALHGTREHTPEERLERFSYMGNGNVKSKWVRGRKVV